MIVYGVLVIVVFVLVALVLLGAVSVWTRDEHPPIWLPPEPRHVRKVPPVYDQDAVDLEDELAVARLLEEADDARRASD